MSGLRGKMIWEREGKGRREQWTRPPTYSPQSYPTLPASNSVLKRMIQPPKLFRQQIVYG